MPVLLRAMSGRLAITADGRTEGILPGPVMHMRTRLAHAVEAIERSALALLMLDAR